MDAPLPNVNRPERSSISRTASLAASLLGLAVALGAFGAHALRGRLDDYSLGVYHLGVTYQFYHAFGLGLVAALAGVDLLSARALRLVSALIVTGIAVFCGSLYLLALTGERWLGAITPIGGTLLIIAWVLLAVRLRRSDPAAR